MAWLVEGWANHAAVRARGLAFLLLLPLLLLGMLPGPATAARPLADDAPFVSATEPPQDARGVPLSAATDGSLAVTFSEPVALAAGALELSCERSADHVIAIAGGDTRFTFTSDRPFLPGEHCLATVRAAGVADLDADDPPDAPQYDYPWSFRAASEPVVINELDPSDAAGGEAEFIELYDGGRGATALDGLTVVLYRGDEASVYLAVGLDGYQTDAAGYFVLGASGVAGADLRLAAGTLRDGPDAVAVYDAPESDFPRNAPVAVANLLDAVVYGPAGASLLVLLEPGQAALDEDARGAAAAESLQRCPNGAGKPRQTAAFQTNGPTPGGGNSCTFDAAPSVISTVPTSGAKGVPVDGTIEVVFSEPVMVMTTTAEIACEQSGIHAYTMQGGGTVFRFLPSEPFAKGETCVVTLRAEKVSDVDSDDPPDHLTADAAWFFDTITPAADTILINEIDADTPGIDTAEFIELFDGGAGHTALDGLAVVLFNGTDDRSYLAVSLNGQSTDANGYFLLANAAVDAAGVTLADGVLQNGPDAVVVVAGDAANYPNGTPAGTVNPLDALVYSRPSQTDTGLQPLLNASQPQVDENGRGAADSHSNQRCPNGAGGRRNTAGYKQNTPTPGGANDCVTDTAPGIAAMSPGRGATGVGVASTIAVEFDEPVTVTSKWANVKCAQSGVHSYQTSGGPDIFTIEPDTAFAYQESCTVTVFADRVADQDTDDPPDMMVQKVTWSFTTVAPPADFLLINEVDADTPGSDTAEFIELFDGGAGQTALDGLALVLFNGSDTLSYRSIDLDGYQTGSEGYFLIGNDDLNPDLLLSDGVLQNGPDAVALYAADAAQFPNGMPVTLVGLIDALVYGDPLLAPPELLALLASGQQPVAENGRGAADTHSMQRCPNGSGGARQTDHYLLNSPTPGEVSNCEIDEPPTITSTYPAAGEVDISVHSAVELGFSEPIQLANGSLRIVCDPGGQQTFSVTAGPQVFTLLLAQPLPYDATCHVEVTAAGVTDLDLLDPPDAMAADYDWSFATAAPPPDFILINEIESDTPGTDKAEFIELTDGGVGHTDLSGLVVILYNGQDDRSYHAISLDGEETNSAGYLVIGNSGVEGAAVQIPNGLLQNGADAVALYAGDPAGFPNGTALHARGLVDAVVYGTADPPDSGLLVLLESGEPQVDEAGDGAPDLHSIGRCSDGGGPRRTHSFRTGEPTPGEANNCPADEAPVVLAVEPVEGATSVPLDTAIRVAFSEAVSMSPGWITVNCDRSGDHTLHADGDGLQFEVVLDVPLMLDETCAVTLHAAQIFDADNEDPPDNPTDDFDWNFSTRQDLADFIMINEVDTDTPGKDSAEFIELYDGGLGHTPLGGLVVVLWNGKNDSVYGTYDLAGKETDGNGYFILGNEKIESAGLILPDGALQNGPDAITVYVGNAADFPKGRSLVVDGLLDAIVYGPAAGADAGLLPLLAGNQPQVDEAAAGASDTHSLQRCPNGYGGQRRTETYQPRIPTPGAANECPVDAPPSVSSTSPADGATAVDVASQIVVIFSEDVLPGGEWARLSCELTGERAVVLAGGPREFTITPAAPLTYDDTCELVIVAGLIHDADPFDPPDTMPSDLTISFSTEALLDPGWLINEVDADTPGSDTAELIELTDGGAGNSSLDGLVVVLWNGSTGRAARSIDLQGYLSDADGYFVIGNAAVEPDLAIAEGAIQNGPDAVSLHAGLAADFPAGMPLTTDGLIDALVYGRAGEMEPELLQLLDPGQLPVDEDRWGEAEAHSLQRCPDSAGNPRQTAGYQVAPPTPRRPNECRPADAPPAILSVTPEDGRRDVPLSALVSITFTEAVVVDGGWVAIACDASGEHEADITIAAATITLAPRVPFSPDEQCAVTVVAAAVRDLDPDDPPDTLPADYSWTFFTAAEPPPPPVAAFTSNGPIWIGETAAFTNASSGPPPLSYTWDFGDGSPPATEPSPVHRYQRPGAYTVSLTATGPSGTATRRETFLVRPRRLHLPLVTR